MDEKRVETMGGDERPAVEEERRTELARGSGSTLTNEQLTRVSQPRLRSSAPLSAFQLPEAARKSELDMVPRAMPPNARPYLIAIIALLVGMLSILVYLLFA